MDDPIRSDVKSIGRFDILSGFDPFGSEIISDPIRGHTPAEHLFLRVSAGERERGMSRNTIQQKCGCVMIANPTLGGFALSISRFVCM